MRARYSVLYVLTYVLGVLTITAGGVPVTVGLRASVETSFVTHYYDAILHRAPDVGGKAYGTYQNRRIMNKTDYDNALGFGIQTIYGVDARLDTLGFPRGFVSIEAAVQHEGVTMPVIS